MKYHWMAGGLALCLLAGSCQSLPQLEEDKDEPVPEQHEYSILTDVKDAGYGESVLLMNAEITPEARARLAQSEAIIVPSEYLLEDAGITGNVPEAEDRMEEIYHKLFSETDREELIKVAINFDAANLSDVIPSFATPLKINYILDSDAAGTVTMSVNDSLTVREVWRVFEQILTLAGAYCELDGKVLHIRPAAKIVKESQMLEAESNIVARVIPLKFLSAEGVATQIARLLPSENSVIALARQNALLVVETRPRLDRLVTLITQLDRKPKAGWSQVVIQCVHVPSLQVKEELLNVLPVLGFPAVDGNQDADPGAISVTSLDRIGVIVASAVTPEALMELKRWVKILDRADTGEQERVYIYEVVNGKADEFVQALAAVFPVESSTLSSSGKEGETKTSAQAGGTSRQSVTAATTDTTKKTAALPGEASVSLFDTPVKIFADAVHNRLLIRTTPQAYGMIDAILRRIDTIPTQILMQVLVVEIELNDNNEFGMEFSLSGSGGDAESIFDTNFEALQPSAPPGQTGGKIYIYNPNNPDEKFGYIRAIAGRTNLKVLSSPQILATSHSEAKISVGKRVPIVTSDITDTASSVDPNNTALRRSYQYEDTGIILTVTPQATKGGLISMQIKQIISDAVDNTMRGIDSPIIKEDELNTTLSLRSGRTLILGGLIKEKKNETVSSIPIIADIPFLKHLFGNTIQTAERTEILVLVTATIITEETELQIMLRRYAQAIDEIKRFEHNQFNPPKKGGDEEAKK